MQSFGQDSYDSPPSQRAFPQVNGGVGTEAGGTTGAVGRGTGGGVGGGGRGTGGGETGEVGITGDFSTAVQAKRKVRTVKKTREKIIVKINFFFILLKDFILWYKKL